MKLSFGHVALACLVVGAGGVGMGQVAVESVVGPAVKAFGGSEVTSVGLGSCLRENRPAPIMRTIAEAKPDVFVFLGDNIYGDTEDAAVFRRKYQRLMDVPGFRQLREGSSVLAVWDDHDFGKNDAGVEFAGKTLAKDLFLKFWGEAKESARWTVGGNYGSVVYGREGRRVQMILLDTRWSRSALERAAEPGANGPYTPTKDQSKTILGAEQWAWLEAELAKPAELRVICSSIQVLANEHNHEKWGNFPHERQRLLDLVGKTSGAVLFVSGDRHTGELSRLDLPGGRRVYDLTASALNQGSGFPKDEPNALRRGSVVTEPHFGWLDVEWETGTVRMQLRRESGSVVQETSERMGRMGGKEG